MKAKRIKFNKWGRWTHVMFIEDWRAGTPAYQLFARTNTRTGIIQYRKVKVGSTVHNLAGMMNALWDKLHTTAKNEER